VDCLLVTLFMSVVLMLSSLTRTLSVSNHPHPATGSNFPDLRTYTPKRI